MLHSDHVRRIIIRWNPERAVLLRYCVRSCQDSHLKQNILTLSIKLASLWECNLLDLQMDDVISLGKMNLETGW